MPDVASLVIRVLAVICLGLAVRIFAVRSKQVVYPVALVLVGLLVAITPYELGIRLSRDIIMIGLLPTILFQGAAELDLDQLRENALPPLLLVIPGLPLTAAILGGSVAYLLGLPLLVGLLFGAIIVPTDPAAVLAIFQQLDAPEDLESIIKSESVFNDFVAIKEHLDVHHCRVFICGCALGAVPADIDTLGPEILPIFMRIHHGFQRPEQSGAAGEPVIAKLSGRLPCDRSQNSEAVG